jgi:hypothetical protein
MATVTAHLTFVFFKKEISDSVDRSNTALLSTIVTPVFAFSASRRASRRAYLVLVHSKPADI